MPALQTSAWIPYCSPDILSGYEAKTNKCKNKVRDQRITALKQIQKYQRIKSSLTAMYALVPTYVLAMEFTSCK